ncbi:hypothetical protein WJ40_27085 [Burkholderia cepacia]|nr:hypothetical protein WJ40_27085 [Burkholderia cepacia]
MVKTLTVCAVLCIAAGAFPRFHETGAGRSTPARAFAMDATRTGVHHAATGETGVAASSNDGGAERRTAAALGNGRPPAVMLGEANAGWSALFNH